MTTFDHEPIGRHVPVGDRPDIDARRIAFVHKAVRTLCAADKGLGIASADLGSPAIAPPTSSRGATT